ncbi:hypothetical protein D3C73_1524620 [compost metagenome]
MIGLFDPGGLFAQLLSQRVLFCLHQIGNEIGIPERIRPAITAGLKAKHFLEDFQVMRDRKRVARILVAEEGIEIVETGPGNRRHAHCAGFMS